ncbi:MAG: hypothetical protein AB7S38_30560 [Vulcanimicrobiota bacterium]
MAEHDDTLWVITIDPAIEHYIERVNAGEAPLHQSFVEALHRALEHHLKDPEVPRRLLSMPTSVLFLREIFRETMPDLAVVTWTDLGPKQRVGCVLMLEVTEI